MKMMDHVTKPVLNEVVSHEFHKKITVHKDFWFLKVISDKAAQDKAAQIKYNKVKIKWKNNRLKISIYRWKIKLFIVIFYPMVHLIHFPSLIHICLPEPTLPISKLGNFDYSHTVCKICGIFMLSIYFSI